MSETKQKHNIVVGALFVMSWGYDQTNINIFQVTRISDKGIFIREIEVVTVPGSDGGFMCDKVQAVKNDFIKNCHWTPNGKELFRRLTPGNTSFKMAGRYWCRLTDENSQHSRSWYA